MGLHSAWGAYSRILCTYLSMSSAALSPQWAQLFVDIVRSVLPSPPLPHSYLVWSGSYKSERELFAGASTEKELMSPSLLCHCDFSGPWGVIKPRFHCTKTHTCTAQPKPTLPHWVLVYANKGNHLSAFWVVRGGAGSPFFWSDE